MRLVMIKMTDTTPPFSGIYYLGEAGQDVNGALVLKNPVRCVEVFVEANVESSIHGAPAQKGMTPLFQDAAEFALGTALVVLHSRIQHSQTFDGDEFWESFYSEALKKHQANKLAATKKAEPSESSRLSLEN